MCYMDHLVKEATEMHLHHSNFYRDTGFPQIWCYPSIKKIKHERPLENSWWSTTEEWYEFKWPGNCSPCDTVWRRNFVCNMRWCGNSTHFASLYLCGVHPVALLTYTIKTYNIKLYIYICGPQTQLTTSLFFKTSLHVSATTGHLQVLTIVMTFNTCCFQDSLSTAID
jgi:hypothetical protein